MNERQADKLLKVHAETNKLLQSVDATLKALLKQTDPKRQRETVVVERPRQQFIGRG